MPAMTAAPALRRPVRHARLRPPGHGLAWRALSGATLLVLATATLLAWTAPGANDGVADAAVAATAPAATTNADAWHTAARGLPVHTADARLSAPLR